VASGHTAAEAEAEAPRHISLFFFLSRGRGRKRSSGGREVQRVFFFLSFSTETAAYNECGDSKRMLTHARGTGLHLIGEQ
jgi:hypothetical protein